MQNGTIEQFACLYTIIFGLPVLHNPIILVLGFNEITKIFVDCLLD